MAKVYLGKSTRFEISEVFPANKYNLESQKNIMVARWSYYAVVVFALLATFF